MNKDDILKRSRAENKNGDEREEKIKLRSYATSASIGAALCAVFLLIEIILFERFTTLIWVVYFGMMFSKYVLDAVSLKKKSDIVTSVLFGFSFVLSIVKYISENIG